MPQAIPAIAAVGSVVGGAASIANASQTRPGAQVAPGGSYQPTPAAPSVAQTLANQSQSPLLSGGQTTVPQAPDYSQNLLQMLNTFQQQQRGGNF